MIGIITLFHSNYNWGGVLQGYALKMAIQRIMHECGREEEVNVIKYSSGYNPIYPNVFEQMKQYSLMEVFEKVFEKYIHKDSPEFKKDLERRKKLFKDFMQLGTSDETVYTDESIPEISKRYKYVICGSDQVWNPNVVRRGYLLSGMDDSVKIAYSASIARDGLSKNERNVMIPEIQKLDYISVREKTAKNILTEYMGKGYDIFETLDPTMLLTAQEWRKEENCIGKGKKYALCFFFSDSYGYRKEIERYCEKNSLELYFIPFAKNKFVKNDNKGKAKRLLDVGPREFLYLFDNAECVFTDSFHGAVFSLIFQKQFCVFERDKNTNVSKNSRLYDLLGKFDVKDRLIKDLRETENVIDKKINFEKVESVMKLNREKSIEYLKKALS